ncbi:type VI secretion system baseplate subunit TssG [Novosphingobium bradum]|uniref:Type VI secretion system baseplate subunit TssG n=1 Tax=Novosphingobium bradum TaxID=1737444 RepID=A0ABV7ITM2_9SPHN
MAMGQKVAVLSDRLRQRLRRATLPQAARVVEELAARAGRPAEVGHDAVPSEEPLRFAASERMHLVAGDLARVEPAGEDGRGAPVRLVANVLGLAGASPALPAPYSEMQLARRRARDWSFADFLNIFDHRALSFFYRIVRKYSWTLLAERGRRGAGDPVQQLLVALGGLSVEGLRERLDLPDAALVTLTAHLADSRRSARSVETILRTATGLPLRVIEACPVWMSVPRAEQTRIGLCGQFAQLGDDPAGDGEGGTGGLGGAAMIGASVLDVQHHYTVEIGPLGYGELHDFCARPDKRRVLSQLCILAAGLEQRPSLRLLIPVDEIPELQLGREGSEALLGWTTWLGRPEGRGGIAADCAIPISEAAIC